jgi:hypothetical protein
MFRFLTHMPTFSLKNTTRKVSFVDLVHSYTDFWHISHIFLGINS